MKIRRLLVVFGIVGACVLTTLGVFRAPESAEIHTFSHTGKPVTVDKIYPSMTGPTENMYDLKLREGDSEMVWITGYSANMIAPDGSKKSQEFMCHDTLSVHNRALHRRLFDPIQGGQQRLFTLSQGQEEVHFPPGFGIPVSAAENLMLQSQVLNLREEGIGATVRHKVDTQYVLDRDLSHPMKALALVDGGINVDVEDPQAKEPPPDHLSCAPDAGGQPTFLKNGHRVTAHWVVHPGYEKRETVLGKMFPIDTTAHYISVHMHNYGKSLELYDMTADQTVFRSVCTPSKDGKGLAAATHYCSETGLPVYRDHIYKVISEYDNTSGQDQTAMAFVFVYIYNPDFKKPSKEKIEMMAGGLNNDLCRTGNPGQQK